MTKYICLWNQLFNSVTWSPPFKWYVLMSWSKDHKKYTIKSCDRLEIIHLKTSARFFLNCFCPEKRIYQFWSMELFFFRSTNIIGYNDVTIMLESFPSRKSGQQPKHIGSIHKCKSNKSINHHIPCLITILAIWIIGSFSASGKIPFRPAHSISKLRIRTGAILSHSPENHEHSSIYFKLKYL